MSAERRPQVTTGFEVGIEEDKEVKGMGMWGPIGGIGWLWVVGGLGMGIRGFMRFFYINANA